MVVIVRDTVWMRDGKFPVARSVGGRMAWLESEIDEWMLSRRTRYSSSITVTASCEPDTAASAAFCVIDVMFEVVCP